MKRASPEYQIQKAVTSHLQRRQRPNVYWTAIPMGENRNAVTGARIKASGGRAGAPDMLILCGGICYGLEIKAPGGRMSMSQVLTRDQWRAAGGVYAVAYGLDEALSLLVSWDAIRKEAA